MKKICIAFFLLCLAFFTSCGSRSTGETKTVSPTLSATSALIGSWSLIDIRTNTISPRNEECIENMRNMLLGDNTRPLGISFDERNVSSVENGKTSIDSYYIENNRLFIGNSRNNEFSSRFFSREQDLLFLTEDDISMVFQKKNTPKQRIPIKEKQELIGKWFFVDFRIIDEKHISLKEEKYKREFFQCNPNLYLALDFRNDGTFEKVDAGRKMKGTWSFLEGKLVCVNDKNKTDSILVTFEEKNLIISDKDIELILYKDDTRSLESVLNAKKKPLSVLSETKSQSATSSINLFDPWICSVIPKSSQNSFLVIFHPDGSYLKVDIQNPTKVEKKYWAFVEGRLYLFREKNQKDVEFSCAKKFDGHLDVTPPEDLTSLEFHPFGDSKMKRSPGFSAIPAKLSLLLFQKATSIDESKDQQEALQRLLSEERINRDKILWQREKLIQSLQERIKTLESQSSTQSIILSNP